MCQMISCLVSKTGKVYAVDGVHSHSEIATRCKVDEDRCLRYEFDLTTRTLRQDFEMDAAPFAAKQSHDMAAQWFFDASAGSAAKLIAFVKRGNWSEQYLLPLLSATAWKAYDEASVPAWKAYNEACVPAWKAYNEACATARKAYNEACATARKAYDEACATACKAYDEACVPAWKAYNEACATARKAYDEACATARKAYDEACATALKAYDEACVPAWKAYNEPLATAWCRLFRAKANRIAIWQK